MTTAPRRIGVVGSGVAGLTAAYVASRTAHVTLFEADDRLGGHADTHVVASPDGELRIDTGFIVHNRRTYPTLLRLFAELDIATQPSEMSLSVSDQGSGVEYAGALGARGLFPTCSALRSPDHWRMLAAIPRFHRRAAGCRRRRVVGDASTCAADQTLREFLDEGGFSDHFVRHFMEPMVAAVWSCDPETSLDYPARYLFTFLEHHGMLGVFGSPEWRTVTGGSGTYVAAVAAHLQSVRTGTKITSVRELDDRRRGDRRQRPGPLLRRDRHRHAPLAGPDDAGVADGRPGRGAQRAALLRQHRAPAHRHLAAAGGHPTPGRAGTSSARRRRPARSPSPTT